MKKILMKVPYALICAAWLWIGLSFIEIISQNSHPNPQYSPFNIFELGLKYIKPIWY